MCNAHRAPRSIRGEGRRIALGIVAGVALATLPTPLHAAGELVPLYTWFGTARGDYFSTTNAFWASSTPGELRSGYKFERVEGLVFSASKPRPAGTLPLYLLYDDARGDNFTTADPVWNCTPGTLHRGYECVSLEGYVHDRARAGTLELDSFWSPSRADNAATTNPIWSKRGSILGYDFYRIEGWIDPAPADQFPETPEVFGYGSEASGKPPGRLPTGVRPLLVLLLEYPGRPFRRTQQDVEALFSSPSAPNVVDFFAQTSYGAFTWDLVEAKLLHFPKTLQEMTNDWIAECGGIPALYQPCKVAAAVQLAAQNGFDFASYDSDGDGQIWPEELTLSLMHAELQDESYGQTEGAPIAVPVAGKVFYAMPTNTPDSLSPSLVSHELGHALGLGVNEHIYGSKGNSETLSIMSGHRMNAQFMVHFDPFNKTKFGWVRPRIARIDEPGGAIQLHAQQTGSAGLARPLLLYDPRRGTREFWLFEFRSSSAGLYDANAANGAEGIAAWYVQIDYTGTPIFVPGLIQAGNDGVLQTVVDPNDLASDTNGDAVPDQIESGPDDFIQSTASSLDVVQWDPANWVYGSPPDEGFYGYRGQATLFDPGDPLDNPFTVRWLDTTVPDVRFRIRAASGSGATRQTVLEWSTLPGRLPPRLDELVPTSVSCGASVVARGEIGVDGVVGYWLEGGGIAVAGSVQGTSATEAIERSIRVPWGLRRGGYQLGLRPSADDLARSNGLALAITSCDYDADGVDDRDDNCPTIANASQLDRGGLGTGSAPDGRGDACQCGDVNGDGRVTLADATAVMRSKLIPPTAMLPHPERCDVTGDAGCTLADAVVLRRAVLVPPTAQIGSGCAPPLPFVN